MLTCRVKNCTHEQAPSTYFCKQLHQKLWLESIERAGVDFSDDTAYECGVVEFAHRAYTDETITEADIL